MPHDIYAEALVVREEGREEVYLITNPVQAGKFIKEQLEAGGYTFVLTRELLATIGDEQKGFTKIHLPSALGVQGINVL